VIMKRRHKRTTAAGVVAAVATALAGATFIPPPFNLVVQLVGAIALAILGKTAADHADTDGPGAK